MAFPNEFRGAWNRVETEFILARRDISDTQQTHSVRDGSDEFEQTVCKGVSIMGSSICFDSDDVVERVRQRVLTEAEEKIRFLSCPEHCQPVKLTFDGNVVKFEKFALAVIGKN